MKITFSFLLQSSGLPKLSSTEIRNQDVHTNGPVLDDVLLADPEVTDSRCLLHDLCSVYKVVQSVDCNPNLNVFRYQMQLRKRKWSTRL